VREIVGRSCLAFPSVTSKSFIVVIAVLAVIGLLAYGLLSKGEASLAVGDRAPDKELSALGGTSTGRIADYRGKWVLLNFWASWCEPCRSEAPLLEDLQRRYGGPRFTVLGVDLYDSSDDALSFTRQYGLSYPQLREAGGDDRKEAYGMTGFPESFLIDPQGKIAVIRRGPVSGAYLREAIVPLIGARS
jgi:cytochrome c biogenesis protein CcmG, thiol:disulfide interchange protein DsbE